MSLVSLILIVAASTYTSDFAITSTITVASINFFISIGGVYTTLKRKKVLQIPTILFQLVLVQFLFLTSIEQTGVNQNVLFLFIIITPLIISLFGIKTGIAYGSSLIIIVFSRQYLYHNNLLSLDEKINNQFFEIFIIVFLLVYLFVVFGYYAYTINRYRYLNKLLISRLDHAVKLQDSKNIKLSRKIKLLNKYVINEAALIVSAISQKTIPTDNAEIHNAAQLDDIIENVDSSIRNIDNELTLLNAKIDADK
jgi:hypothetical protein